ncbi:Intradiol ring-cleavage dioxygenase [Xylaria bambusicola]|uniref:Intradiol ring-cleavage dioxygenase n=1 Tax=Xylaria bambusicola TaxID=326684 RepID=UPI002007D429|nr:Intradiol ring-cleavage dioxygenase [Xylaria bambusicola]KAI0517313.1 Intradiol ring-cleavage dioxygenase [Xylaria bambusicola]
MINVRNLAASLAFTSLIGAVVAHPGEPTEKVRREILAHREAQALGRRAISACASSPKTAALKARATARRAATAEALRQKRGLTQMLSETLKTKRDQAGFDKWTATEHDLSSLGYDLDTPLDTIFSSNATCTLVPEIDIGPYWVGGELMRTDVVDGQPGVPFHLDLQLLDLNTCEPIPAETLVDIWSCNATGIYSGVSAEGQGGLDSTHGRGVQSSDEDGVVQFDTIFPGHYPGRTPHIHVMTTSGATLLENGTYVSTSGTPSHIGQLFFDQDIILETKATEPYSFNEQPFTTNEQDSYGIEQATIDYDPFVDYVRLGDDLSDGLLGWITVFIDTTKDVSDGRHEAAHYYEDGGVDNSNPQP